VELKEGFPRNADVEAMRQAVNDFGETGYRGPCPPRGHGTYHYHFRLMALDTERHTVKERVKCKDVEAAARADVIATAELVGTYAR
jgi:hypothetical protein